ncbi:MAG: hypothetical protein R3F50_22045 [Gammaproteobacteria bacterium]
MRCLKWNPLLSILLAISGFFSLPAFADGTYIGEACWEIQGIGDEEPSEGTDYIKLAIFDIGDGHFTLNGYSFSSDDESVDERTLLNGNGELFGDQIIFQLSGLTSDPDEMFSLSVRTVLSLSTLSGTVDVLGTGIDRNTQESGILSDSGTVTIAVCP